MSHTDDSDNPTRRQKIRMVTLPPCSDKMKTADLLETVFYYGQNDFAIGPEKNTTYSLSTADVVSVRGRLYLCLGVGWKEITGEQFKRIRQMSRRNRVFLDGRKRRHSLVFPR
jgi:hypothetical protein